MALGILGLVDTTQRLYAILVTSAEVIGVLKKAGWYAIRVKGSHHHFAHPANRGIVTVPHPRKDLPHGTIRSIERQAGLRLR
jgi:predicted RNA binding protein YcfA (HicA-like mRNA interferase family)